MAFVYKKAGVALVTPFIADAVNLDVMGEMIDRQIEAKIDALIVLGTTGEPSTMSDAEKEKTARYCVRRAAGRTPVIVGCGGNDTQRAAQTAKRMRDAGADALLAVTPYYNRATQDGLVRHFTLIADAANIPLMIYNVPSRTGVNMLTETVKRLKGHPMIRAYKQACESITQLWEDCQVLPPDIEVFAGNDDTALFALAAGASGVVSVAANVDPWSVKALCDYFFEGDMDMSRSLQSRISHLSKALFSEVSPIPCKFALEIMGFKAGQPRLPLTPMSDEGRAAMVKTLMELGLIKGYGASKP